MEVMKCEPAQLALTAAAHPVIGYQILKVEYLVQTLNFLARWT